MATYAIRGGAEGELEALIAELTRCTTDPRTMLACPRVFQVRGQRLPAAAM